MIKKERGLYDLIISFLLLMGVGFGGWYVFHAIYIPTVTVFRINDDEAWECRKIPDSGGTLDCRDILAMLGTDRLTLGECIGDLNRKPRCPPIKAGGK